MIAYMDVEHGHWNECSGYECEDDRGNECVYGCYDGH